MTNQAVGLLVFGINGQNRLHLVHSFGRTALDDILGRQQQAGIDSPWIRRHRPFEMPPGFLWLVGEKERPGEPVSHIGTSRIAR